MADSTRIEDLRRRVQKDPASIAFAQLAEECRRAGNLEEAVSVARAGLALHPTYLSARVTLGRTLLELNQLDDAQTELQQVLRSAPENLAALRALAETLRRLGNTADALTQYRAALALAKNDPDIQDAVAALEHEVETPVVPEPVAAPPTFSYADPDPIELAPAAATPNAFSYADPDTIEPQPAVSAPSAFSYADPEPESPEPVMEQAAPVHDVIEQAAPVHEVDPAPLLIAEPEAAIDDLQLHVASSDTHDPDPMLTLPADFFIREPEPTGEPGPAEAGHYVQTESSDADDPVEAGYYVQEASQDADGSAEAGHHVPGFDAPPEIPEAVLEAVEAEASDGPAAAEIDPAQDRAVRTLVVLEQWLQAVHVSRAERHP